MGNRNRGAVVGKGEKLSVINIPFDTMPHGREGTEGEDAESYGSS